MPGHDTGLQHQPQETGGAAVVGTKALQPEKGGCSVQWDFDITSGIPLLGGLIASFAGDELRKNIEDEFKVLKASA